MVDRRPDRLLTWTVVLIALHSVGVGVVLVWATEWGVRFGGWPQLAPVFFARQFGMFHFAIAAAYLIEWFRYRGVSILVTAKVIGCASLVDAALRYGGPWSVPLSAVGDGAMGLVVVVLALRVARRPSALDARAGHVRGASPARSAGAGAPR